MEEENSHNSNNEAIVSPELVKIETEKKKLYRTRSCSERSDSGISDCSNHALTSGSCSCTSTPLLGKRFSINEEPEYKKIIDETDVHNNNNLVVKKITPEIGQAETEEKVTVQKHKEPNETRRCLSDKVKRFSDERLTGMLMVVYFNGVSGGDGRWYR